MVNKEDKVLIIIFVSFLGSYSFFLWEKIDFYYIILLTFASASFIKTIYDIKNRTVYKEVYVYSEKTNRRIRYLVLAIAAMVLYSVLYVVYTKL